MTLQEAVYDVSNYRTEYGDPELAAIDIERSEAGTAEAIATILNAVVKGELVSRVTAMHTISLIGKYGHMLDDDMMNILEGNSVKGELK